MYEREGGEVAASHAVAYSDEGSGHLGAEDVDCMEEITGVVKPGGWSC
jgi:hypothetical protein